MLFFYLLDNAPYSFGFPKYFKEHFITGIFIYFLMFLSYIDYIYKKINISESIFLKVFFTKADVRQKRQKI
jgi:uncharacterized membrane protein YhdT